MLVVADTGPIISLLEIHHLDILEKMYPDYVIPGAVYKELLNYRSASLFTEELEKIKLHISNPKSVPEDWKKEFGIGESESIALVRELNADYFLVDDNDARKFAESMSILCFGTISLLSRAKSQGLIPELKNLFEILSNKRRFFSKEIIAKVLRDAGEI